ncbi:MAG: NAD-dependent epimerase/dehydratase family protein, partial [Deltaproteobacteria bacterium]
LLGKGHELYSFSRSDHLFYKEQGITWFQGDICDFETLKKAVSGMNVVFHTASKVSPWGRWEDFYSINVMGTKNTILACQEEGVKKLIYTSSPSVVFGKNDLKGADESTPYPKKFIANYGKSKAMAEESILNSHGKKDLATVALRPHLIFGEEDPHLIPRLLKKKLFQVGNGDNMVDVIYVENAADAHILAMEKLSIASPIGGKAYFLGQEKPIPLWDFIGAILKGVGRDPIKKKISLKFAYNLGLMFEKIYQTLGIYKKEPPITRFVALQLGKHHYFDHTNAEKDLGYHPQVNLKNAIERTINGFI